jgi:xanthine/CO dehydrogenase XdhC/CoxF family maturation factor
VLVDGPSVPELTDAESPFVDNPTAFDECHGSAGDTKALHRILNEGLEYLNALRSKRERLPTGKRLAMVARWT